MKAELHIEIAGDRALYKPMMFSRRLMGRKTLISAIIENERPQITFECQQVQKNATDSCH
ncbi:unnamed protein product [Haemonchus placei]|uniref:Zn_protease domain-containing protein n=1 Tax=Haemonchus placei TaxID=6290 RepID=A0A0N4W8E8_HAEPC|nr:unnamed protein product [Haemonchus placei]